MTIDYDETRLSRYSPRRKVKYEEIAVVAIDCGTGNRSAFDCFLWWYQNNHNAGDNNIPNNDYNDNLADYDNNYTNYYMSLAFFRMGGDYWEGLIGWLRDTMLKQGCIGAHDLDLMQISDDPEEVALSVRRWYDEHTVSSEAPGI